MNTANSMILYSKGKNCLDTGLLKSILRGGPLEMTGGGGIKNFQCMNFFFQPTWHDFFSGAQTLHDFFFTNFVTHQEIDITF